MAQRTVIELIDDLTDELIPDGQGQTIAFAFRGVSYEIDLSDASVAAFDSAIAPYIERGRRIDGRKGRSRAAAAESAGQVDTKAVRAWAEASGIEVSARGRLSADVVNRYRAAQAS